MTTLPDLSGLNRSLCFVVCRHEVVNVLGAKTVSETRRETRSQDHVGVSGFHQNNMLCVGTYTSGCFGVPQSDTPDYAPVHLSTILRVIASACPAFTGWYALFHEALF